MSTLYLANPKAAAKGKKNKKGQFAAKPKGVSPIQVIAYRHNPAATMAAPKFGGGKKKSRSGGGFASGLMPFVKEVFSTDNLLIAGGVAGSVFVSAKAAQYIQKNNVKLPGIGNPIAATAYFALPPILLGVGLRNVSRPLSRGLILGGVANAFTTLLAVALTPKTGGAGKTITGQVDNGDGTWTLTYSDGTVKTDAVKNASGTFSARVGYTADRPGRSTGAFSAPIPAGVFNSPSPWIRR